MCCHGEELGPFCWPMLAQALQFLVHFIDLLSILLRGNGFPGIQKAVVDQMGNRTPVTITCFFLVKFGFGKCFGASSQSSHWAGHHWSCKIHFSLYITIQWINGPLLCRVREDDTSKGQFFLIFSQLMKHLLIRLFHLSNLLQMPYDCRLNNNFFFQY